MYFYEPQLLGFHIAGKRGSKYFMPDAGGIVDTRERQERLENEFMKSDVPAKK